MYDRLVKTPRLVGSVPADAHPVIPEMIELLSGTIRCPWIR